MTAAEPRWTPLDAGLALEDAERACRAAGAWGPSLAARQDGWEASAWAADGSSPIVVRDTPDEALTALVALLEERSA